MEMGPAFADHAPGAQIGLDQFHVVGLATEVLEEVRRDFSREMRKLPSPEYAQKFSEA